MTSTFGGIELAKRALQTQQKSLMVTGHNIANANNENYSRQQAVQGTTTPYTVPGLNQSANAGQIGTGVEVKKIERMRDNFVDSRIRAENHGLGEWEMKKENLKEIESIFNELEEGGLVNSLDEFWTSWQELNNNPESLAMRETLVQKSITLTTQMNHFDSALEEFKGNLGTEIEGRVDEFNALTSRIASLNDQIKAVETDGKKNANDLIDERDALLDDLSKLADVNIRTTEDNEANVSLNGINVVQGKFAHKLEESTAGEEMELEENFVAAFSGDSVENDGEEYDYIRIVSDEDIDNIEIEFGDDDGYDDGTITLDREDTSNFEERIRGLLEDEGEHDIKNVTVFEDRLGKALGDEDWELDNDNVNFEHEFEGYKEDGIEKYQFQVGGNSVQINSGEIKGLQDVRDKVDDYRVNNLDRLTRRLVSEVNHIHGNGYDMNGDAVGEDHENFFTFNTEDDGKVPTAGHIQVNENIVDDPSKIAASANGELGDGSNAQRIADLRYKGDAINSTGFNDYWQTQTSMLGIDIERADRMHSNQKVLTDSLKAKRDEVSGVSLDEEMTEMVKFQHGYNAAGRVISRLDEMFNTLVNTI
ncbi:flagellar hook-associated protein FlgK [Natroniella acetigena]|uniref:flagellar hook-associated protein FlgK n=1 Tax=Natroniella acetigena TaxID=52004 RepID=UPI00200A8210|nr:flagellar hook-associated protein FlgK [Natroniella acetigena]MCK8827019.1 flagellar hook-associated protein FlgK [Natroniella acetigena]